MPEIKVLEEIEEAFWWDVARRSEHATFFQTPLWHRLAQRGMDGFRDVTFGAEVGRARAVMPLMHHGRSVLGIFGEALSTFAGCYGGPVTDRPLTARERTSLYDAARGAGTRLVLTGNPLMGPEPAPQGFRTIEDTTHALRLDAPFDDLFTRFSKGHRSSTNRGRRHGVTSRRADCLGDYRSYFSVYHETLERWGEEATSRYPWSLFEEGWKLASEYPDNIVLWLGELDGEVIAGAWVFYWNRHATYWHGAANDLGREISATNVVLAEAIEDAGRRGVEWFDFGPSGGHEGVAAFKRRFGAERLPFHRFRRIAEPVGTVRRMVHLVRGRDRHRARGGS